MDRPLSPWLLGCSAWGLWAGEAECLCLSQPQFPHLSCGGEDGGAEAPAPATVGAQGRSWQVECLLMPTPLPAMVGLSCHPTGHTVCPAGLHGGHCGPAGFRERRAAPGTRGGGGRARGEPCGGVSPGPRPLSTEPPPARAMAVPSRRSPPRVGLRAPAHRAHPAPCPGGVQHPAQPVLEGRHQQQEGAEGGWQHDRPDAVRPAGLQGGRQAGAAGWGSGTHPGKGHRHHRCLMPATGRGTLATGHEFSVVEEIKPEHPPLRLAGGPARPARGSRPCPGGPTSLPLAFI